MHACIHDIHTTYIHTYVRTCVHTLWILSKLLYNMLNVPIPENKSPVKKIRNPKLAEHTKIMLQPMLLPPIIPKDLERFAGCLLCERWKVITMEHFGSSTLPYLQPALRTLLASGVASGLSQTAANSGTGCLRHWGSAVTRFWRFQGYNRNQELKNGSGALWDSNGNHWCFPLGFRI